MIFTAPAAQAVTFGSRTVFLVGAGPRSVAVGDFNGDSDPDLAVANQSAGTVSILLGAAGAGFTGPTNFSVGTSPRSVAVGDFNGDSDPDLATANMDTNDVSILLGAAGGSFTGPTSFPVGDAPYSVAVGDFNGDADPDLATANNGSDDVSILLGAAGGSFTGPTSFAAADNSNPHSLAIGDFNGDSDPDLAVANNSSEDVSILLGAAGGSFTAPTNLPAPPSPTAVAVGDFNGDSDADLAVTNYNSGNPSNVSILLGAAGGSFTGPTTSSVGRGPDSVAVGDLDRDFRTDLVVGNHNSDDVSILLGAAGGGFTGPTNVPAGLSPESVTVADFNADSMLDLAIANQNSSTVSVLQQTDTTAPETTIDSGPSGPTSEPAPTFTFSSSEPGSTFECRVDTGAFAACGSPHTTIQLADGPHAFEVRATDNAANTDQTPAIRSFAVDTAAALPPGPTGPGGADPGKTGPRPNPPPPPALSELNLRPRNFRAARSGASVARKQRHRSVGTTVSFVLSTGGTVAFKTERALKGRMRAGRCRKLRRGAKGRRCTRYAAVRGAFEVAGAPGKNRLRFTGRISDRELVKGRYRLLATPRAAGRKGAAVRASFGIR